MLLLKPTKWFYPIISVHIKAIKNKFKYRMLSGIRFISRNIADVKLMVFSSFSAKLTLPRIIHHLYPKIIDYKYLQIYFSLK